MSVQGENKMKKSLVFLLICFTLNSLAFARVHQYIGDEDIITIKLSVGKTVTVAFPEPYIAKIIAGMAKNKLSIEVVDSLLYLRLQSQNWQGRLNVVGASRSNYTIDILMIENARESDDTVVIERSKVLDSPHVGSSKTPEEFLRPLELMRLMVKGDERKGVDSEWTLGEKSRVIMENEFIQVTTQRIYSSMNGLKGFVLHVVNKTDAVYPLMINKVYFKGLAAIHSSRDVLKPNKTIEVVRDGNLMHKIRADMATWYVVLDDNI